MSATDQAPGPNRTFYLFRRLDAREPAVDPDAACEVLVGDGHLPPHLGGFGIGLGHRLLAAMLRLPEMVLDLVHPGRMPIPGLRLKSYPLLRLRFQLNAGAFVIRDSVLRAHRSGPCPPRAGARRMRQADRVSPRASHSAGVARAPRAPT